MSDIDKLHKLRDMTVKHIPIGDPQKNEVLELFSYLEKTMDDGPKSKTWVTIKDAVAYYGVATHTVYTWRRNGRLKSRPAPNGNRIGYEYYLDPHLKEEIEIARKKDKRWL